MWREDGRQRQKNFKTKAEAKKFAVITELTPERKASKLTVAELLEDYRNRVTPTKKGASEEGFRLGRLMKRDFAKKSITEITAKDIQDYADARILEPSNKYNKTLSPTTLTRDSWH